MIAARPSIDVADTVARAERAARLMAANGFAAVRTHVDTTIDHGLTSIEAVVEVRRRVADVIDVEIVALGGFAGDRGRRAPTSGRCSREALEHRRRPRRRVPASGGRRRSGSATEYLLGDRRRLRGRCRPAHRRDARSDRRRLGDLAELVDVDRVRPYPVTASHCVSLGMQPVERQREDRRRRWRAPGSRVVALPATNLYLQGRDHQRRCPAG